VIRHSCVVDVLGIRMYMVETLDIAKKTYVVWLLTTILATQIGIVRVAI
jgi:hypothetical protein